MLRCVPQPLGAGVRVRRNTPNNGFQPMRSLWSRGSSFAGVIPTLLHGDPHEGHDAYHAAALRFGEHLLASALRTEEGWSWNTLLLPPQQRHHDLTGFSHGASGIGWVLLELFAATADPRWRTAAEGAFHYERHHYDPAARNWYDYRPLHGQHYRTAPTSAFALAWCHGAPGIALARLRALAITGEAVYRAEAESGLESTLASLQGGPGQNNYSLCHGQAGNADILLQAALELSRPDWVALAETVGLQGIEWFEATGTPFPLGYMGAGETPALLVGMAGIGYFYLRLYEPTRFPTPLLPR